MKKIKNFSIRLKIFIPVSFLVIILIFLSLVSFIGMVRMKNETEKITDDAAYAIEVLGDIESNYQSLRRIAYAHIVEEDSESSEALSDEGNELIEQIKANFDLYETTIINSEKQQLYDKVISDFTDFVGIYRQIVALSSKESDEQARVVANTKYSQSGKVFEVDIQLMLDEAKKEMKKASDEVASIYRQNQISVLITVVLCFVSVGFVIFVSNFSICNRLINIDKQLRGVIDSIESGEGDLTKRVQCFNNDEIGRLAGGINKFIETLQRIMGQITYSSKRLDDVGNVVMNRVTNANSHSVDISAVMEELSASMQEVASTIADIKCNVGTADYDAEVLAGESNNLFNYAVEMKDRANKLEKNAIDNKQSATEVIGNIVEKLKLAIERSKSVEQVNNLTDEILSIAGQTNLLSLNASIEAARAGEAGRGFAVVAEEISQLSNSSRAAANNIQEINSMVIRAVNELISSSNEMVEYISSTVLPDYDVFVNAGKQYNDDAVHIDEIVTKFNELSVRLREIMQGLLSAIDGINCAVDESANGVSNVAMNTTDLVRNIEEIEEAMGDNQKVAGDLTDEANRFISV